MRRLFAATCWVPQTALPLEVILVGVKAAENQPQVIPRAVSRSPIFLPVPDARACCFGAIVEGRGWVGNHSAVHHEGRSRSMQSSNILRECAARLSRSEVERTQHGRAISRVKEVVADAEALRVVPYRGDGVAVDIPHDEVARATRGLPRAGGLDELVHAPAVVSLLLCGVAVIVVAERNERCGLRATHTPGLLEIGIVLAQLLREAVYFRRIRRPAKRRLTGQVFGMGISCKIMIERLVFLKDDDHMV